MGPSRTLSMQVFMRKYINGRVYDTLTVKRVASFFYSDDCGYFVYLKRTCEYFIVFFTSFSVDIICNDSLYTDVLKLRFKRLISDALNDGLVY